MNNRITPFLKWPGGKAWLFRQDIDIFPKQYKNYYEPFLGGGSVFFALQPEKATISDSNGDLINLYKTMRDNPKELAEVLFKHQSRHNKEYYYQVRESKPRTPLNRAGRFLYLNRTCFNGMYRVNSRGEFNVPIGTKQDITYDIECFSSYSEILKRAEIVASDFHDTISAAGREDFIFADPPYAGGRKQSGFVKYNEKLFSWADQERLFNDLVAARNKGTIILSTNANYKEIIEMYQKAGFYIRFLERHSSIAGTTEGRRSITELLISTYPID